MTMADSQETEKIDPNQAALLKNLHELNSTFASHFKAFTTLPDYFEFIELKFELVK